MAPTVDAILDQLHIPCLRLSGGLVSFANPSAQSLLGSHIVGENIRIALRNPAAVRLADSKAGGRIRLDGLFGAGSVWEMNCHVFDGGERLITLDDLSVSVSVARAHSDFVANASHELRTPLSAILGYVETLADPKMDADPAIRARFLETIKREADRMQSLIEDLMSLSRIEAGKHDAPEGLIDLVELSGKIASESGESGRIVIESDVTQAMITGDHGQMAQVLRNLVDNALKYGKRNGRVVIAIESAESGWLRLTVSDEGEGIEPEHLPRLTERFYRADAGRSRAAGGTGLGLSIVKHIVERHRGLFDISSTLGIGTSAAIMFRQAEA